MSRYPEWFLGGPWHGEDKRLRAPNLDRSIQVAVQPDINYAQYVTEPDGRFGVDFDRVEYVPQRCIVFGERLTVWVLSTEIPNLGRMDSPISKALGELIMLPHRDPDQRPDMRGHTDLYRHRWEVERQVRAEMEATYRRRLMDASIVNRPEFNRPEPVERYKLGEHVTCGVYVEIMENEHRHVIGFEQVTTFFDHGNDEMSPAWVATAQGEGKHSETQPYTGYGTSEKAAILALAADRLGVYARMVDLEKESGK